jgi:glucokinase
MILAADIGGTNARVGFFVENNGVLRLDSFRDYRVADYPGLEEILQDFLRNGAYRAQSVAIGVAGPVVNGRAQMTNVPWVVDAARLGDRLKLARVHVLNDLEAHGCGIHGLGAADQVTLQAGVPKAGNRALIAAGTGLGECLIFHHRGGYMARPSEGGHADFSPHDAEEMDLLTYLLRSHQHVSWEKVLSGKYGFGNLYAFLRDTGREPEPAELRDRAKDTDNLGPLLQAEARRGTSIAVRVMRLYVRLYGAEAGNLALKALSLGGLYVGGGIAPAILPWLQEPDFLAAFSNKGRMSSLLKEMPVHVVLTPHLALRGAAEYAWRFQS